MKKLLLLALLLPSSLVIADIVEFQRVDINEDGVITLEEAIRVENLDFKAADLDQDGFLSREEYHQAVMGMTEVPEQ